MGCACVDCSQLLRVLSDARIHDGWGDVLEPRLAVRVVRYTDRCVRDRLEQSYLPWLARYRYGAPPPGARCMVHSCIVTCLLVEML